MSYIWQDFNIKTFPAETIVFRDGVYCPELSTIDYKSIDITYDLPVHIIYVGNIKDDKKLNIELNSDNQNVFVSVKINVDNPAFLKFFIKNSGENSKIKTNIIIENKSILNFNCFAEHLYKNTGIFVKTKLLAHQNSVSKLSADAIIKNNVELCQSSIDLSAMADDNAKIIFLPAQHISTEPDKASHSASIFRPNDEQILYLRESGLSGTEVMQVMREAFFNDIDFN